MAARRLGVTVQAIEQETRAGKRVLALAARPVANVRHHLPLLRSLEQGWFERGLRLLGLVVLDSPLKVRAGPADSVREDTLTSSRLCMSWFKYSVVTG